MIVLAIRPIVVPFMEDQPEFEARIGTTDPDAIVSAQLQRFVIVRVLVPIEYRPDLIAVFERVLLTATSWIESEFARALGCLFCNRVGNAHSGMKFDLDERSPAYTP